MGEEGGVFRTPRQLAERLGQMGLQLHAKNRIGGGESNFLWHLAEVLHGVGRLTAQFTADPQVGAAFGNANEAGTISAAD